MGGVFDLFLGGGLSIFRLMFILIFCLFLVIIFWVIGFKLRGWDCRVGDWWLLKCLGKLMGLELDVYWGFVWVMGGGGGWFFIGLRKWFLVGELYIIWFGVCWVKVFFWFIGWIRCELFWFCWRFLCLLLFLEDVLLFFFFSWVECFVYKVWVGFLGFNFLMGEFIWNLLGVDFKLGFIGCFLVLFGGLGWIKILLSFLFFFFYEYVLFLN